MAALPFLEAPLDDAIARGMEVTLSDPGRTMLYGPTGELTQNFAAANAIYKYDLAPGIKYARQFLAVQAIWHIVHFGAGGPYKGFLVKDYSDPELTQSNSRLTLISGSVYQINRVYTYTFGAVTDEYLRPIYKPAAGMVVKRTRSGVVSTATATVDTTTGQATISGHTAGDTYTAVGIFYVPVTFSENEWTAKLDGGGSTTVSVSGSIKLEDIGRSSLP